MPTTSAAYLSALHEAPAGLIEVRFRRDHGMGQRFIPAAYVAQAAELVEQLGRHTDVYVGVAPRCRHAGGRDAIEAVRVLWADCDTEEAVGRLEAFTPTPSIVVRSGSQHGRHAYWLLSESLSVEQAESVNRRLARTLRADTCATDAARILRPPATRNFKYEPAGRVELEHLVHVRLPLAEVTSKLVADTPPRSCPARQTWSPSGSDPLLSIPPEVYVRSLLGVDVPSGRKIQCPFHDDRTPSLHVYGKVERGWFCFGCQRGSTIYDMAAELWGLGTRGSDFCEVRRRLLERFGLTT